MNHLLQVDFPYNGPWNEEMVTAMRELADSIAKEPGLVWKIWTENKDSNHAGGVYLFTDKESAQNYLTMHTQRLQSFGIAPINAMIFEVNQALSLINKAPL